MLNYQGYINFYLVGFITNMVIVLWFAFKVLDKFGLAETSKAVVPNTSRIRKLRFLVPFIMFYGMPENLYLLKDSKTYQEMLDRKTKKKDRK